MRRPTGVELSLVGVVVLWALNLTVSRWILTHGFRPLAYSTVRYGAAVLVFAALTLALERSLRVARRDLPLVLLAAALIWANQVAFVYALRETTASTVGLIFGATPVFAALIGVAAGVDRVSRRFWAAALVSFGGVGLVAAGGGGDLSGDLLGDLYAVATAASWAAYSVAIGPLMARYSPSRISALVLALGWLGMAAVGAGQTASQPFDLGAGMWLAVAFAVLGPLVVTNILWFRSVERIGAARATLAANLQPFVAVVFALALLGESISALQVAGGALIAAGIALARRPRRERARLRAAAEQAAAARAAPD